MDHPRPLLRRDGWVSLDGIWDFAADRDAKWRRPEDVAWETHIRVPFAPETPASGVGLEGPCLATWYRRRVDVPALGPGERFLLHFGAVDHEATVWVDGHHAAHHAGGYAPFALDLAPLAEPGRPCTVVVRAFDDPHDLSKPRGKQTWRDAPHGIWYPGTSGIWRSVWAERVPVAALDELVWSADFHRFELGLEARTLGFETRELALRVRITGASRVLVDDVCRLERGRLARRFALADGFDERSQLAWCPELPVLLDATLELRDGAGRPLDRVASYTAMRTVGCERGRFTLNGRPYFLRLALDQGYWPETGATPPDTEAAIRDVEWAKRLGFNGVRKHQKTEDPRWLAACDRLGLLTFVELPSAPAFDDTARRRGLAEWTEIVGAHRSHPCVAGWIPVNESWGTPGLGHRPEVDAYAEALVATARALDPSRPVIANDGWEAAGGDIVAVHDYDQDPARLAARWQDARSVEAHLEGWSPITGSTGAMRRMLLAPRELGERPVLVSEFGGVGLSSEPAAWGYSMARDGDELVRRHAALCRALARSEAISGFCYTQLTDTYQEVNGLLTMDRTPKADPVRLALATAGLLDPEAT